MLDRIIRKRRSPLSARGQGRKGDLDARGWKGGFDAWRVNVNDTATLCSHGRVLPSLLLLGCMKCATTLLHKIIVKACPRTVTQGQRLKKESWFRFKEKHYFDRNETIEEGVRFYVQHYPRCPDESRAVVGLDSTQAYLKTPWAAPRAATTYGADAGRVRFIVVLREPVARLLSNYHHRRKSGDLANEPVFEAYAVKQLDEAAACGGGAPLWGRCGARPTDGLWVGLYHEQLRHWLAFFSAPQFALVPFSEVTGNQDAALRALLGRLELPCAFNAPPLDKRVNSKTPGNATIDDAVRASLAAFYAPANDALVRLVHAEGLRVELAGANYSSRDFADYACDSEPCAWPF